MLLRTQGTENTNRSVVLDHCGNQEENNSRTESGTTVWSRWAIPGNMPKEIKANILQGSGSSVFIVAVLIAKLWNEFRCLSTDEWVIHTHKEDVFSHKGAENHAACRRVEEIEDYCAK